MAIVEVERIGDFVIPDGPEARRKDSEFTVHGICGRYDPELARKLNEWGDRVGQEYSYRRKAIEDVRVVLDIGANVGAFSVWASRVWWPDCEQVFAYEPNVSIAQYADVNIESMVRCHSTLFNFAVTTDPAPIFHEHVQAGRSHTWGTRYAEDRDGPGWEPGRKVPGLHPRELPPADAIKCDAEGVEVEIFENYQHWDRIKVAMWEWHGFDARVPLEDICRKAGLVLAKNDCGTDSQGVQCWVRP